MAIEAAEKLRYLLERRYGRDAAQLDQILQATPMAITLSGHFHGQPAVFKRNLHPNARANVRALPDILAAYDTVMDEQSQVHPLLGSIPRLGISIFGHVEGVHPSDFFTTAEDTARDQVIRALDRWLGRSARLGSEPGILSPNWLLQRTQTRIDAMPDGTAKTLARRLFRLLDEFASLHHAHPIHLIVGHGDCHSGNFLWVEPNPDAPATSARPGRLCAIDIGGQSLQPVAKMFGQFMAMGTLRNPSDLRFGVSARDFDILASSTLLSAGEAEISVPFYVASMVLTHQCAMRQSPHMSASRTLRIKSAINDITALLERGPCPLPP